MSRYEVMFIIPQALEDDKKASTIKAVEGIIENGGKVTKTDVIGTKKLAYPIQKKSEGYYVLITFEAPKDLPKELDRRLKISDFVVRHIIMNLDDNKDIA
jgi:small subunit ribosomal protein S6